MITDNELMKQEKGKSVFSPQVDIFADEANIYLVSDIPGADEKSLDISIEKNILTIYAKSAISQQTYGELKYSEYKIGDYKRSFTISEEVNSEKIEANYKDGILKLTLPRKKAVSRKIEIKAA